MSGELCSVTSFRDLHSFHLPAPSAAGPLPSMVEAHCHGFEPVGTGNKSWENLTHSLKGWTQRCNSMSQLCSHSSRNTRSHSLKLTGLGLCARSKERVREQSPGLLSELSRIIYVIIYFSHCESLMLMPRVLLPQALSHNALCALAFTLQEY